MRNEVNGGRRTADSEDRRPDQLDGLSAHAAWSAALGVGAICLGAVRRPPSAVHPE